MSDACNICGRLFKYTSILKLHYRSHTREKPFQCVFCEKSFSFEAYLIVHRHVYHQKKEYVCDICNSTFLERSNLEQHSKLHKDEGENEESKNMLSDEKGSTSYTITITKPTSTNSNISNKGFLKHFGSRIGHLDKPLEEKPYACHLCGKRSSQKSNLKAHFIVHTKEKPFVCDICGKAYTRNHNLKLHRQIHVENPFACDAS